MDRTLDQYFNRRILGAVLSGVGGFLRAASDRDPKMRRQRYARLLFPIAPEVVARFAVKPETREDQPPGGRFSLIPFGLAYLGLAIFVLFIRPRVEAGHRPKRVLFWRRLGIGFDAAGALLRNKGFPFANSRTAWAAATVPILGEVVEETIGKHHPKLARVLTIAMGAALPFGTWWIGRSKHRDDHSS